MPEGWCLSLLLKRYILTRHSNKPFPRGLVLLEECHYRLQDPHPHLVARLGYYLHLLCIRSSS